MLFGNALNFYWLDWYFNLFFIQRIIIQKSCFNWIERYLEKAMLCIQVRHIMSYNTNTFVLPAGARGYKIVGILAKRKLKYIYRVKRCSSTRASLLLRLTLIYSFHAVVKTRPINQPAVGVVRYNHRELPEAKLG